MCGVFYLLVRACIHIIYNLIVKPGTTENPGLENTRPSYRAGWKTRDQWLWNAEGTSVVKQKWMLLYGAENIQELVIFYML